MKRQVVLAALVVAAFALFPGSAWADNWVEGMQDGVRAFLNFEALFDFLNRLGLPRSG